MADQPAVEPEQDVVVEMTSLLVKALRSLGQAGLPDAAGRLGGKAWWVLKEHPREAERVNGVLHFLAKLPAEEGAAPVSGTPASTPPSEENA